jgi:hypothetical protein
MSVAGYIDKQKEEQKACWMVGGLCYVFIIISILIGTGIIDPAFITIEVILWIVMITIGMIVLLKIIIACDKFSTIDEDHFQPAP